MEEVLILNKGVLGIGNCLFRFDYHEGVISPLREGNGEIKVSFFVLFFSDYIHATLNTFIMEYDSAFYGVCCSRVDSVQAYVQCDKILNLFYKSILSCCASRPFLDTQEISKDSSVVQENW